VSEPNDLSLTNRISEQVLPEISDSPDPQTEEEITRFDYEHNKLVLQEHQQTISLRTDFAKKIFRLVIGWVIAIFGILILQGFAIARFNLANSIILALIGSTTLNIVGLLYVVTHYLFPQKP